MKSMREKIEAKRKKVEEARNKYYALKFELEAIIEDCPHPPEEAVRRHSSANCGVCEKDLGWWCEKNPNGRHCEYDWEEHDENCVHCGAPEERK